MIQKKSRIVGAEGAQSGDLSQDLSYDHFAHAGFLFLLRSLTGPQGVSAPF